MAKNIILFQAIDFGPVWLAGQKTIVQQISMEYYSYEKYEKDNDEYVFAYMLPCKSI